VVAGLVAAIAILAPAPPAAADWLDTEHRLTAGDGVQQWPQLSGTHLVYTDLSEEHSVRGTAAFDVWARDLTSATDTLLTPAHTATGKAAVSGTSVVWPDLGDGADPGLRYADLATGAQRRLEARPGSDVAISGSRVCYSYLNRIRVYDLRSRSDEAVSPAGVIAGECDISGAVVVWQDARNGNADIYAYDLDTRAETRLTTDPADQTSPKVEGNLVVWQDARNGADNADIYAYDLAAGVESPVCVARGNQTFPDTSGGRVVWTDDRLGHGNTEVFLHDQASGLDVQVSADDGWSGNPSVSGPRIVWEDVRGAGHNLYQRTITPPVVAAGIGEDDSGAPAVNGVLTGSGARPVVGATLVLESSADGRAWTAGDVQTTAGDGSFSFPLPAGVSRLRVRYAGSLDNAPAVSSVLAVR
jgi:beta propeller repeat protein